MGKKVFVGMSGGVDSSLSAALLVEQGYDVKGIYMRNWSQDLPGFKCPWAEDLADAERVAVMLGIDLEVWDYEEQYKRDVVDYLVDSYQRGCTPNPDVMCNEKIKFGVFAEKAFAEGADFIATGHYARVRYEDGKPAHLLRAADEQVAAVSQKIYDELTSRGVEVIWDDREVSAGVMFSDADLFGVPVRVVVSPKGLKNGTVEISSRDKSLMEKKPVDEVVDFVHQYVVDELAKLDCRL